MLPVYVVNNHGQFNHLILRMLRDIDIDARMIGNDHPPDRVSAECRGIILGGGPTLEKAGRCAEYLDLGIPVLGICLGLHIIALAFGGEVRTGRTGGYGAVEVDICKHDKVLGGYPDRIRVWASHADEVSVIPDCFTLLARSGVCDAEAIAHESSDIFGLQWHPEVSHSVDGSRVYRNFDLLSRENA